MQNPEPSARSVLVQTTVRVTEGEDDELLVVCDRGCQTVTTVSPDVQTAQIVPLLEYTPYSEIANDSIKVYDLPKKNQIQFEFDSKRKVRSASLTDEGLLKGALKKSSTLESTDTEGDQQGEIPETAEGEEAPEEGSTKGDSKGTVVSEDSSRILSLSLDPVMVKKSKQDQDCQTDLTVIPAILDDDAVANVSTQLGVQTSLTFPPGDSLTKVTPELTRYLSHTHEYQALFIDGKIITNVEEEERPKGTPDSKPEDPSIELSNWEEGKEPTKEPEEDPDKKDEVEAPTLSEIPEEKEEIDEKKESDEQKESDEKKEEPLYKFSMTEEEFEKNVQRILDNTVKNVYDFMAKIVEMYEKSKVLEEAQDDEKPKYDLKQIPDDSDRRGKAFAYIEGCLQAHIPPDQFTIVHNPDGSRLYHINDPYNSDGEVHVEEKLQIIWPSNIVEPELSEEKKQGEEEDMNAIFNLIDQIHKNELASTDYTETLNPDGTRTFLLTMGEINLKVLVIADIVDVVKSAPPDPNAPEDQQEVLKSAPPDPNAPDDQQEVLKSPPPDPNAPGDQQEVLKSPPPDPMAPEQQEVPKSPPPDLQAPGDQQDRQVVRTEQLRQQQFGKPKVTAENVDVPSTWEGPDEGNIEPSILSAKGSIKQSSEIQSVDIDQSTQKVTMEEEPIADEDKPEARVLAAPMAISEPEPPLMEEVPADIVGDTQQAIKPRDIDCECCRVHDGGAAPPPLSIGEKKLTLEFKVGGPKTVEKTLEGLKVKATFSDTNECPVKDKTIVVSFNVSEGDREDCNKAECDCPTEPSSPSQKKTYDSDSIAKSLECTVALEKDDECSCSSNSQTWTDTMEETKKDIPCYCAVPKPTKDQETRSMTATKKCGPECSAFTNRNPITSSLCQALREQLTDRPETKQEVCQCGKPHSTACIDTVPPEIAQKCLCKQVTESPAPSIPKICENSIQRVMESLKCQKCKDPALLEQHLKGLQSLLQKMEGISLQSYQQSSTGQSKCVCVSSVQVIYKKSEESKVSKEGKCQSTCTNLREKYKPPPPILPVSQKTNKACTCDLTYSGTKSRDTTPLYEQEGEYNETYYDISEERVPSKKGICSLPEVANETDRCKNRTELPWLKMTLPPNGSIKLKKQPKKPCDCKKKKSPPTMERITGSCVCPEDKKQPKEVLCTCKTTKTPVGPNGKCYCKTADGKPRLPTNACTCKPDDIKEKASPPKQPEPPPKIKRPSEHEITCPCRKLIAPCPELQPTRQLYDDPYYATNEEYMNPLYKMYPDDSEDPCGIATEIDWADYTLPTNVKLKSRDKKKVVCPKTCGTTTSVSQMSRGTGQSTAQSPTKAQVKVPPRGVPERPSRVSTGQPRGGTRAQPKESRSQPRAPARSRYPPQPIMLEDASTSKYAPPSMVELELKFSGYTEIISTVLSVEGGAAEQTTLSEFSAISDVTRTIKRMDPEFVKTMLAGDKYGAIPTVGSAPFKVDGDIASSMPQLPEKESDLIKLISYDSPAQACNKPTTMGNKPQSTGRPSPLSTSQPMQTTGTLPLIGEGGDLLIITSAPQSSLPFDADQPPLMLGPIEPTPFGMMVPIGSSSKAQSAPIPTTKAQNVASKKSSQATRDIGTSCRTSVCSCNKMRTQSSITSTPMPAKVRSPITFTISPPKPLVKKKTSSVSTTTGSLCSLSRLASPILAALKTVEKEMKPLHDTLNELRAKIQSMDIPELTSWSEKSNCSCYHRKFQYDNTKQVNLFMPQVQGPFYHSQDQQLRYQEQKKSTFPKRCVCLENVDDDYSPGSKKKKKTVSLDKMDSICLETVNDDYSPRNMQDIVNETMGLDKMMKQSTSIMEDKPRIYDKYDLKDYKNVIEKTMALDKMIRQDFKKSYQTRTTQSDSSIKSGKRSTKRASPQINKCVGASSGDKPNFEKKAYSTAVNVSLDYPSYPNYYPNMMDWFYQSMYNAYFYNYYYPQYSYNYPRQRNNICNTNKKVSIKKFSPVSSAASTSITRSFTSVATSGSSTVMSETYSTSYGTFDPSTDFADSVTDDGPRSHRSNDNQEGRPVFKPKEGLETVISADGAQGFRIILKPMTNTKGAVCNEEICSSSSS